MEDWHNFGADYDTTLMAWYERFLAAWPEIADNYSERFKRMFTYYLNACAGAFRARDIQLWQVVFSRGVENGLRVARYRLFYRPLSGGDFRSGFCTWLIHGSFSCRQHTFYGIYHCLSLWINFNVDACAEFFLPKSRAFQGFRN